MGEKAANVLWALSFTRLSFDIVQEHIINLSAWYGKTKPNTTKAHSH